jgi:lysophospholipase L1-like esterase
LATTPPSASSTGPRVAFLTLGTNHIYRLKDTGEIVDNCEKRPQVLFQEEELSINQCVDYLSQVVDELYRRCPDIHVVVTVSPIRYAKYGFHGSQLSKAVLLLAANQLTNERPFVTYFPAYEIVLDELRDYRFYQSDMLHPSDQAVEYIWQQLVEAYFSPRAKQFLREWKPIKEALGHRPFQPDSDTYREFLEKARRQEKEILARYSL